MALTIHNGVYPAEDFRLWRDDTKTITLINGEDFPIQNILKWLNIGTVGSRFFGNCDGDEARERLSIMKFFYDNPDFISLAQELRNYCSVPNREENFRDFYDPRREHNPFWENYHQLIAFLEAKGIEKLPSRIRIFYDAIISFRALEADEKEMVRIVGEMLEANAVMEGAMVIPFNVYRGSESCNCDWEKSRVELFFGHKTFSYGLSEARQMSLPDWLVSKKGWRYRLFSWNWGKIVRQRVSSYNQAMKKRALRSMVLKYCPEEIKKDVVTALAGILASRAVRDIEGGGKASTGFLHAFPMGADLEATVYFAYGDRYQDGGKKDGLAVKILDIRYAEGNVMPANAFFSLFNRSDFEGYSSERKKTIEAGREHLGKICQDLSRSLANERLRYEISKASSELKLFGPAGWDVFANCHDAPSPLTDSVHKWRVLDNIYRQPEISPVYSAVSNFYFFTANLLGELKLMQEVLSQFMAKASEIGATVCFPEILPEGKNVVEFSELYPLHLDLTVDGEKVRPVPINNLPPLNGRMIGLTGRHGGGKTVVEHTIAGNVYLALSGLPVFGKKFRLNPKTHIGLVFVEGVKGRSVAQTLLDKTEKLFLGIRDVPQSRVVVIVDELGSNTQAEDGLVFGQRVLKTLATMPDTSVIFSTQILQLAKFAEAELGAKCFFVNKEHRLNSGIRGGEFSDLVDESKLKGILVK